MDVIYLTDLEGDYGHLVRFIETCEGLRLTESNDIEFTADNFAFVFGGDLFDRYEGDIKLAKSLSKFKRKYPERVWLLVGNRDINKLRFYREISQLEKPPVPFWDRGNIPEYEGSSDDVICKLKYVLKETMGAGRAFELRKSELKELTGESDISEEQVANSFLDSVVTDGFVLEFLQCAQLAAIVNNCLFIHAGIAPATIGFTPTLELPFSRNQNPPHTIADTPQEWVDSLNDFYHAGLKQYEQGLNEWYDENGLFPGAALIASQSAPATAFKTPVVVSAYSQGTIDMSATDQVLVEQFLSRSNISVVCSGHKPIGDCPLVCSLPAVPSIYFVYADTSHNRQSVTSVLLSKSGIHVDGFVASEEGRHLLNYSPTCLPLIGRRSNCGWWVRSGNASGLYRLCRQTGRSYEYRNGVREEEVKGLVGEFTVW